METEPKKIEITKEHPNVKVTFKLKMGVVTTKPQIIKNRKYIGDKNGRKNM